ncbi:MAG: hypothetical protein RI993_1759 [Pseudomonadota bacterium]
MLQSFPAGLYAITPDTNCTVRLCEMIEQVLANGVACVQYRNKAADQSLRFSQAREIHWLCRQYDVPLIINDDVDLALEIDAEGLHVGENDITVPVARKYLADDKIIGVSCYNQFDRAVTAEAQGASYVAFGAFFQSATKINAAQAGVELLQRAKDNLRIPAVAIGGINLYNAPALLQSGCFAIAVCQGLFTGDDICATTQEFSRLFNKL